MARSSSCCCSSGGCGLFGRGSIPCSCSLECRVGCGLGGCGCSLDRCCWPRAHHSVRLPLPAMTHTQMLLLLLPWLLQLRQLVGPLLCCLCLQASQPVGPLLKVSSADVARGWCGAGGLQPRPTLCTGAGLAELLLWWLYHKLLLLLGWGRIAPGPTCITGATVTYSGAMPPTQAQLTPWLGLCLCWEAGLATGGLGGADRWGLGWSCGPGRCCTDRLSMCCSDSPELRKHFCTDAIAGQQPLLWERGVCAEDRMLLSTLGHDWVARRWETLLLHLASSWRVPLCGSCSPCWSAPWWLKCQRGARS